MACHIKTIISESGIKTDQKISHLQQPYIESDEDIVGHFLFYKEDIQKTK